MSERVDRAMQQRLNNVSDPSMSESARISSVPEITTIRQRILEIFQIAFDAVRLPLEYWRARRYVHSLHRQTRKQNNAGVRETVEFLNALEEEISQKPLCHAQEHRIFSSLIYAQGINIFTCRFGGNYRSGMAFIAVIFIASVFTIFEVRHIEIYKNIIENNKELFRGFFGSKQTIQEIEFGINSKYMNMEAYWLEHTDKENRGLSIRSSDPAIDLPINIPAFRSNSPNANDADADIQRVTRLAGEFGEALAKFDQQRLEKISPYQNYWIDRYGKFGTTEGKNPPFWFDKINSISSSDDDLNKISVSFEKTDKSAEFFKIAANVHAQKNNNLLYSKYNVKIFYNDSYNGKFIIGDQTRNTGINANSMAKNSMFRYVLFVNECCKLMESSDEVAINLRKALLGKINESIEVRTEKIIEKINEIERMGKIYGKLAVSDQLSYFSSVKNEIEELRKFASDEKNSELELMKYTR